MFNHIYRLKKSMLFKICVCLFVMVYFFNGMFFEYEKKVKAFAFLPFLSALSPQVISSVATVMVGVGLHFVDEDAMASTMNDMAYNARDLLHRIVDAAQYSVDGVIEIATDLWEDVRSYTQENYEVGENITTIQPDSAYGYVVGESFIVGTKEFGFTDKGDGVYTYWTKNTVTGNSTFSWDLNSSTPPYYTFDENSSQTLPWIVKIVYTSKQDGLVKTTSYGLGGISQSDYESIVTPANVMGSDVIGDPAYDFGYNDSVSGDTVRKVQAPSSPADVIGKTYSDVQVSAPAQPQPTAVPSLGLPHSWVGSWDWNISGQTKTAGDVGSIAVGMSGTWSGTWAYRTTASGTQELVWTGTYTDVDGLTWSGDIISTGTPSAVGTGGLDFTLPTGVTLDFAPLMLTGDVFKSKFPFSIPWDIYNSINALNVGAKAPKFTIGFKGVTTDIDFTIFEQWAVIVRWGVMIMFNIGLIILTRRVIGG